MPLGCVAPNAWVDLQIAGTPPALTATPILSPKFGNILDLRTDGIYAPGVTLIGSATFPSSPVDGQLVVYEVTATSAWVFRFNSASSSSYKWEFAGGAELIAQNDGAGTLSPSGGNNWNDLNGTGVGPDFQVPFAGTYDVEFGAQVNPAVSGNQAQVGLSISGNNPTDPNVAVNGQGNAISVMRYTRVGPVAQNDRLRLKYRDAASTGTSNFQNRWLKATPVRCSN